MNLTLEMLLPLAGILLGAKIAASVSQRGDGSQSCLW